MDRVVTAAESSGSVALHDSAQRLDTAWERSGADDEAAPDAEFGRAANDLASACVERGFTYPDVGFD